MSACSSSKTQGSPLHSGLICFGSPPIWRSTLPPQCAPARAPGVRDRPPRARAGQGSPLDVERSFLAVEEFELFLTCLDELPPKCRQVFVMHRLRKLSTQEVAVELRISDRMVRKHIARALIYCRYRLDGLSASAALERIGDDKEETRG